MVIWNHWNRRYQQLWAKIDHIYYGDLWKESKNIDHCFENIEWTSMLSFIHKYVQGYIAHNIEPEQAIPKIMGKNKRRVKCLEKLCGSNCIKCGPIVATLSEYSPLSPRRICTYFGRIKYRKEKGIE